MNDNTKVTIVVIAIFLGFLGVVWLSNRIGGTAFNILAYSVIAVVLWVIMKRNKDKK